MNVDSNVRSPGIEVMRLWDIAGFCIRYGKCHFQFSCCTKADDSQIYSNLLLCFIQASFYHAECNDAI